MFLARLSVSRSFEFCIHVAARSSKMLVTVLQQIWPFLQPQQPSIESLVQCARGQRRCSQGGSGRNAPGDNRSACQTIFALSVGTGLPLSRLTRYRPSKMPAIESPNPNITNEKIDIQVRTLFDTSFASSSIGGLLVRCNPSVRSLSG